MLSHLSNANLNPTRGREHESRRGGAGLEVFSRIFFHPDPRSLAAFRIGVAGVTLAFAVQLAPDFAEFYGALPNHLLVGLWIFLLLPLAALALGAGLYTRWSILLCWFGICFVEQANPYFLHKGDILLRILFFWSIFLPLGQEWSLDKSMRKFGASEIQLTNGLAAQVLLVQVASVYWFTALLKTDPLWRVNGNALFFIFNLEHCTSPVGRWLLHFPVLLQWMTLTTWHFELFWPLLLFVPWRTEQFRFLAVIGFFFLSLVWPPTPHVAGDFSVDLCCNVPAFSPLLFLGFCVQIKRFSDLFPAV